MKFKFILALLALAAGTASAQHFSISARDTNSLGIITFSNTYYTGVSTLEGQAGRRWVPLENFFTTQRVGQVRLALPSNYPAFRVRTLSVVPGTEFAHLTSAYGNIHTIGGTGPTPTGTNLWRTNYEGALATQVPLSNPRAAVVDEAGRIYIVEQDSHAVSVIETNGTIHTAIGTRVPGLVVDADFIVARDFPLRKPTGLYYSAGSLYVLDAGNGRVMQYTGSNGLMRTIFSESDLFAGPPTAITNGGGLTISQNGNTLYVYYTAGTTLKRAALNLGACCLQTNLNTNFIDLATVTINPFGQLIVADRGDNSLWRLRGNSFTKERIAGTGSTRGYPAGKALFVALPGPSSISYLPIGGYFISLDAGASVFYVNESGEAGGFIFGKPGVHAGDGGWFHAGGHRPKISNVQSVALAPSGDIILLEGGFVRKIDFLRHLP